MSLPPRLPPRAPAIAEQVASAESALSELEKHTPRLQLANAERQPGAHKALRDHLASVVAAKTELDGKIGALEAATELDREAAAGRRELIRTMDPFEVVEGITRNKCPDACSSGECVLAGGLARCFHPFKGGMSPEFHSDLPIRHLQAAAHDEISAQERGDYDDDDEDGEYEDDADDESDDNEELEDDQSAAA